MPAMSQRSGVNEVSDVDDAISDLLTLHGMRVNSSRAPLLFRRQTGLPQGLVTGASPSNTTSELHLPSHPSLRRFGGLFGGGYPQRQEPDTASASQVESSMACGLTRHFSFLPCDARVRRRSALGPAPGVLLTGTEVEDSGAPVSRSFTQLTYTATSIHAMTGAQWRQDSPSYVAIRGAAARRQSAFGQLGPPTAAMLAAAGGSQSSSMTVPTAEGHGGAPGGTGGTGSHGNSLAGRIGAGSSYGGGGAPRSSSALERAAAGGVSGSGTNPARTPSAGGDRSNSISGLLPPGLAGGGSTGAGASSKAPQQYWPPVCSTGNTRSSWAGARTVSYRARGSMPGTVLSGAGPAGPTRLDGSSSGPCLASPHQHHLHQPQHLHNQSMQYSRQQQAPQPPHQAGDRAGGLGRGSSWSLGHTHGTNTPMASPRLLSGQNVARPGGVGQPNAAIPTIYSGTLGHFKAAGPAAAHALNGAPLANGNTPAPGSPRHTDGGGGRGSGSGCGFGSVAIVNSVALTPSSSSWAVGSRSIHLGGNPAAQAPVGGAAYAGASLAFSRSSIAQGLAISGATVARAGLITFDQRTSGCESSNRTQSAVATAAAGMTAGGTEGAPSLGGTDATFVRPSSAPSKALVFRIMSWQGHSMRAFHLAWAAVLLSFFSTFAPAALLPVVTEDLRMSKAVVAGSGAMALLASLMTRLLMGVWVRRYGPRYCQALALLLTAPALACMALVDSGAGFIAARFAIGTCLCTIVSSYFWVVLMFHPSVLGAATATCSSWGNVGSGLPLLVMPLLYELMLKAYHGSNIDAWRASFYFPAGAHLILGALTLALGQDTPLGDLMDWEADSEFQDPTNAWRRSHDKIQHSSTLQRDKQPRARKDKKTKRPSEVGNLQDRTSKRNPAVNGDKAPASQRQDHAGTDAVAAAAAWAPHQMPPQRMRTGSTSLRGWSKTALLKALGVGVAEGDNRVSGEPDNRVSGEPDNRVSGEPDAAEGIRGSGSGVRTDDRGGVGACSVELVPGGSPRGMPLLPAVDTSLLHPLPGEGGGGMGLVLSNGGAGQLRVPQAAAEASEEAAGVAAGAGSTGDRDQTPEATPMRSVAESEQGDTDSDGVFSGLCTASGTKTAMKGELSPAEYEQVAQKPQAGRPQAMAAVYSAVDSAAGCPTPGGPPRALPPLKPHKPLPAATFPLPSETASQPPPPETLSLPGLPPQRLQSAGAQATPPPLPPPLPPPPPPRSPPSPLSLPQPQSKPWQSPPHPPLAPAPPPVLSPSPMHFIPPPPAVPAPPLTPPSPALPAVTSARDHLRPPSNYCAPRSYCGNNAVELNDASYMEWRTTQLRHHIALGSGWRQALQLYGMACRSAPCLLLALNYGFNFGAQTALYNILTLYLVRQYDLPFIAAGALASMPGLLNVFSRVSGGFLSNLVSRRYGMRGRLSLLFASQVAGGLWCMLLGYCGSGQQGLAATGVLLVFFALSTQIASGTMFTIVPYVSFRAFSAVLGLTSAGGNLGGAVLLACFFMTEHFSYYEGLRWMGVTMMAVSASLLLLRFPMWGGVLVGRDTRYGGVQEEQYYLAEWTREEVDAGLAAPAIAFAMHARSEQSAAVERRTLTGI